MLQRARVLASLFRVVFLLTAAIPGVLGKLRWVQDPRGGFTLAVPPELADLLGKGRARASSSSPRLWSAPCVSRFASSYQPRRATA